MVEAALLEPPYAGELKSTLRGEGRARAAHERPGVPLLSSRRQVTWQCTPWSGGWSCTAACGGGAVSCAESPQPPQPLRRTRTRCCPPPPASRGSARPAPPAPCARLRGGEQRTARRVRQLPWRGLVGLTSGQCHSRCGGARTPSSVPTAAAARARVDVHPCGPRGVCPTACHPPSQLTALPPALAAAPRSYVPRDTLRSLRSYPPSCCTLCMHDNRSTGLRLLLWTLPGAHSSSPPPHSRCPPPRPPAAPPGRAPPGPSAADSL